MLDCIYKLKINSMICVSINFIKQDYIILLQVCRRYQFKIFQNKNNSQYITEWLSKLMLSLYNYLFNYELT